MDYELAKKLKVARFPFHDSLDCGKECNSLRDIHVPTLSELIEACGIDFEKLVRDPLSKEWYAYTFPERDRYAILGSTPEEAVANLWLELNKKDA